LAYTYELAVPLKQLGIPVSSPVKFAYQLMINEVMAPAAPTTTDNQARSIASSIRSFGGTKTYGAAKSATDLWGEYTLVQK